MIGLRSLTTKLTIGNSQWITIGNRQWITRSFPGDSDGKEPACNAGDLCLISGFGKSPGEGNGNPLQYSCLENPMDRGTWWATVHGPQRVEHD